MGPWLVSPLSIPSRIDLVRNGLAYILNEVKPRMLSGRWNSPLPSFNDCLGDGCFIEGSKYTLKSPRNDRGWQKNEELKGHR